MSYLEVVENTKASYDEDNQLKEIPVTADERVKNFEVVGDR